MDHAQEHQAHSGLYRLMPGHQGPVDNGSALAIVRWMVGCVFLAEGIQKFLFADALGVGRFMKIGIPAPEVMAPFVRVVEIVCGILLLLGLCTRLATIPLIIDMLVAIASTKIPFLITKGFWPAVHEARTDWSMILGCLALLLAGGGRLALDGILQRRAEARRRPGTRT